MYVRKKWRLQRQNLRKRKKSGFTTSKIYVRETKIGVYNVKIYVGQKKSAFTTSKFT